MTGLGQAPGLGEGYEREDGDGCHGVSGIRADMEWTAGYDRRPTGHEQRWSWQNRGGTVDELHEARVVKAKALLSAEPDETVRSEVARAKVAEAITGWATATKASQLGRSWGVTHSAGVEGLTAWLIDGPVGAVLDDLGYTVVE